MIITLGLVILAVAMYPEDPETAIFAGILAVCHTYTLVRELWW